MTKDEQAQSGAWYAVPPVQELPLCMRVEDAGKLVGLDAGTAYRLARTTWRPFVRQSGKLLLVKTAGLLRWIDTDEKETESNG
jgi:hypothetical protein